MGQSEKHVRKDEWYRPADDGKTHINVYSKGKTELGRKLSNFSRYGFKHPDFGSFDSVEGFWYWYATGCKYDIFRSSSGIEAKRLGQDLPRVQQDDFETRVKEAIFCKVIQNPELCVLLRNSELPFVHYYYYGDPDQAPKVIPLKKYDWMMDELEEIREILKKSEVQIDEDHRPSDCICTTPEEFAYCKMGCLKGSDELDVVFGQIENGEVVDPSYNAIDHEYKDLEVQVEANLDAMTMGKAVPLVEPPPDGEYEGEDEPGQNGAFTDSMPLDEKVHVKKRKGSLANPHGVKEDDLCRYREDWEYPEGYSRENDGMGLLEDGEMVEVVEIDSDIDEYEIALVKSSQGLIQVNVCHLTPIGHVDGIETDELGDDLY